MATGESTSTAAQQAIRTAVESPQRDAKNVARDIYRHPLETLTFFGVTPAQTVVEVWPGAGWYAEILAPLLRDHGKYIAAAPPGKAHDVLVALFARDPKRFDKAVVTTLQIGKASENCLAGKRGRRVDIPQRPQFPQGRRRSFRAVLRRLLSCVETGRRPWRG
ncbi:MAG: hypothetical protein WDN29_03925 [Methylovirgula sp.]